MTPTDEPFVVESADSGKQRCELTLSGELDPASAPQVRRAVDDALRRGRHHVSIDAAGVSFIDSTGLMTLLKARQDITEAGGTLRLTGASPPVARIHEIAMLADELLDTSGTGKPGGETPPVT